MPRKSKLQKLQEAVQVQELQLRQRMLETAASLYESPKHPGRPVRDTLEGGFFPLDNFVDPATPYLDTPDFFPLGAPFRLPININHQGRGEYLPVFLDWMMLKWYRDISRRICAYNPFACNALENRVSYIVGKGYKYQFVAKKNKRPDPSLIQQAQAVLDEFCDKHDWPAKEQEIVYRTDRDGETFLRFFDTGHGRCDVRFVEPEYVQSTDNPSDTTFGIITDPDDIQNVLAYMVVENPQEGWSPVRVEADQIIHFKLNTDSAAKRGLPTLFPVTAGLTRAEKLLRNMSLLAQVQATFAVIRKHKGTSASAVQAFQQANTDWSYQDPITGNTRSSQLLQPGSIVDSSSNTDWEFPGAAVNASGYVEVLQAELRAIAARLVMPEFMLSSDASNNNFASVLVAEAPSVKNFERLQQFYARHFGAGVYYPNEHNGVMWRIIFIAVDAGRLPPEVLTDLEIQTTPPSTVVRNKLEEAQRNQILHNNGVLSTRAWAEHDGLDYEQQSAPSVDPDKLLALQTAYFGGQIERSAAIANAKASWHLGDRMLEMLFPPTAAASEQPAQADGATIDKAQAGNQDAANSLRATVGGSSQVMALQTAVAKGVLDRQAAVQNAILVFGFSPDEAEKLFPDLPPVGQPQQPAKESLREEGFFANCPRDEHGHCKSGGGTSVKDKPKGKPAGKANQSASKSASKDHDAKAVVTKLTPEIKQMQSSPQGRAVLKRGKDVAAKAKDGLHAAINKGLEALDEKGGVSLIVHGVKHLDAGAMAAGAGILFSSVFEDVHEEIFENALSDHSLPGAHALGVVAAGAAAKAETAMLKAVAWSLAKTKLALLGHEGEIEFDFTDEAIQMAATAARNTLRSIYKEAGVQAPLPSTKEMAKRLKARLEAK